MSHLINLNSHSFNPLVEVEESPLFDYLGASPETHALFFATPFEAYFHLYYALYIDLMRSSGRNHILTTSLETAAFSRAFKKVEPLGCFAKMVALNEKGEVTGIQLEEAIGPRVALLSLSWANPFTGVMHPIEEIAAVCKKKGILLHVDATHLFGKHYFRLQDLNIDLLTLSLGGRTLLLKKKETPLHLPSSCEGSDHIFLQALQRSYDQFDHLCTETARLSHQLENSLLSHIPGSTLYFHQTERLPNCVAISIPAVSGESLAFLLHRKGIYANIGGKEQQKLAHILMHCGVPAEKAYSSISFSLSYETKEIDIEKATEMICATVKKLQSYSRGLYAL